MAGFVVIDQGSEEGDEPAPVAIIIAGDWEDARALAKQNGYNLDGAGLPWVLEELKVIS